jgi:hypothetical protein
MASHSSQRLRKIMAIDVLRAPLRLFPVAGSVGQPPANQAAAAWPAETAVGACPQPRTQKGGGSQDGTPENTRTSNARGTRCARETLCSQVLSVHNRLKTCTFNIDVWGASEARGKKKKTFRFETFFVWQRSGSGPVAWCVVVFRRASRAAPHALWAPCQRP